MDGKEFLLENSYNTELHQKTADHDTFSIIVPDDALDSFKGYVLENSKNILGNNITINFWQWGKIQQSFSGVIGGIDNTKIEGYVWDWFEDLEKINLSYSHTETKRQIITDRIEPETTVIIKSKIYKSSGEKYNTQFLRILKNGQKYYHHSTDEYTLY